MAESELQKLSKSQLTRKAKQNKGYMLMLVSVLVIYGVAIFILMFQGAYNWKSPMMGIPFILIIASIVFQQRAIRIETELKSRK